MSYKTVVFIIVILVLLVTALYITFFVIPGKSEALKKPLPDHEDIRTIQPEPAKKVKTPSQPPELPALKSSDDFMRDYLKPFSGHPVFREWLTHPDITRRLVAIVDTIARGEIPPAGLTFFHPKKPFKVIKKGNRMIMDPKNHSRYAAIIDGFVAINTGGILDLFQRIHPLLEKAYLELGYPEKKFDDTLKQAFAVILNTPVIPSPTVLEPQVVTYSFKNPYLESLLPVQKMIARTGPDNTRKILEKCRRISRQLKLEKK